MKYTKKIGLMLGVALLVAGAFFTGHYAGAASKTPGSSGDPLITLGYLEGRLAGIGGGMQKVQLGRGDILTGKTGTGIVVLGGSLTAAGAGMVDLTEGRLTEEDTSLFLYHNYIVAEGTSGCEALSSCTLLVSGEFEVE
jgi:hypothetical protein